MSGIEDVLGQVKAGDGIGERFPCDEKKWFDVVIRELDRLSREHAHQLGQETGQKWGKETLDGRIFLLELEEAPPPRLLSFTIVLSAWLGWVLQEKEGDCSIKRSKMIESAFEFGRDLSTKGERP